jgi:outer membrane protein OmpA-like peptidoglycan-associated protein
MCGLGLALAGLLHAPAPASATTIDCETSKNASETLLLDPFIIFFDLDSDAILPPAAKVLNNAAALYSEMPHCTVVILGHTDRSGSADYNMNLARRRAETAATYLRSRGVQSEIKIESNGEERPILETVDGVQEPQNRSVILLVSSPDK